MVAGGGQGATEERVGGKRASRATRGSADVNLLAYLPRASVVGKRGGTGSAVDGGDVEGNEARREKA